MSCIGCDGDYARGEQPCYDFQAVEYDDGDSISDGCFLYRADCRTPERIRGGEPADDEKPCIGYSVSEDDDEPCEMCKGCKVCSGNDDKEDL